MSRFFLFLLCQLAVVPAVADIDFLHDSDPLAPEVLLFDARTLSKCQADSVGGARCLPAATFIAGDRTIASFYHVGWVLGTHGLSSNETTLVFSDAARDRNLVAGILHLAGQRRVWVWQGDIARLQDKFGRAPGRTRGITRQSMYLGIVREDRLALAPEIESLETDGWRLYRPRDGADSTARLIVAGPEPAESIGAFVELSAARETAVKLVIDPYPGPPLNAATNN